MQRSHFLLVHRVLCCVHNDSLSLSHLSLRPVLTLTDDISRSIFPAFQVQVTLITSLNLKMNTDSNIWISDHLLYSFDKTQGSTLMCARQHDLWLALHVRLFVHVKHVRHVLNKMKGHEYQHTCTHAHTVTQQQITCGVLPLMRFPGNRMLVRCLVR